MMFRLFPFVYLGTSIEPNEDLIIYYCDIIILILIKRWTQSISSAGWGLLSLWLRTVNVCISLSGGWEEGEEDLMYDVKSGVRRWLLIVFIITHIITPIVELRTPAGLDNKSNQSLDRRALKSLKTCIFALITLFENSITSSKSLSELGFTKLKMIKRIVKVWRFLTL